MNKVFYDKATGRPYKLWRSKDFGTVRLYLDGPAKSWECPYCGRIIKEWLANCWSCGTERPEDTT